VRLCLLAGVVSLVHVEVGSLNVLHLAMLGGLNLLLVGRHALGFMLNTRIIKSASPLCICLILGRLLFTLAFTEVLLVHDLSAIEAVGASLTGKDALGGVSQTAVWRKESSASVSLRIVLLVYTRTRIDLLLSCCHLAM
jgi:hypothetical protein